jgi:hypothetical protein
VKRGPNILQTCNFGIMLGINDNQGIATRNARKFLFSDHIQFRMCYCCVDAIAAEVNWLFCFGSHFRRIYTRQK